VLAVLIGGSFAGAIGLIMFNPSQVHASRASQYSKAIGNWFDAAGP
jgi:hypothetical protein